MEAVPENGSAASALSTPCSQPSIPKSQLPNGVRDPPSASSPLRPTSVSHLAKGNLKTLNNFVTNSENGMLKEPVASKEGDRDALLGLDHQHLSQENNPQDEGEQRQSSMAELHAGVEGAGSRAGMAENMLRDDRNLAGAEMALNETDLQKNDKMQRLAVPLDAVDSGTVRRSVQDVNISRMRAQFQVDLDAARSDFENQLAEMYQRKLDDMKNQLRTMEQEIHHHQDTATNAINSNRELSQQLAAVQKTNREQEDELSQLRDQFASYQKQHKQETSRALSDHTTRYQQIIVEKEQLVKMCQQKNRDREDELSKVRVEYATFKKQTELEMKEMSATLSDTTARFQQVVKEKHQLAQLFANISAGIKECDALKDGEEERVGVATPERPSVQNPRRVDKRKRRDGSGPRLSVPGPRMASVARVPSPHPGTARTVSPSRSGLIRGPRVRRLAAAKAMRVENAGDKTPGISGCGLTQMTPERANAASATGGAVPHARIRLLDNTQVTHTGRKVRTHGAAPPAPQGPSTQFFCGICGQQLGQSGRKDYALKHMLGAMESGVPYPLCPVWRTGAVNGQDRRDYLLGRFPRRGLRQVDYVDGQVVKDQELEWTAHARGRRVILMDEDRAEAAVLAAEEAASSD